MAVFMTLRQGLIDAVGAAAHREHVVATTDPSDASTLYQIAKDEGYAILPHPLNVGGRFSVLSVVGLFPTAASGVNIRKLLAGAATVEDERRMTGADSAPARYAANQFLSMTTKGRDIHVLMPYADLLHEFGFWYRQLWAESLGKLRDGKSLGPTPIAAFGATDQHSQIQLYNEGPDNKTVTFVEVESFRRSLKVPNVWASRKGIEYVGGLSFSEILHAERAGTEHALASHGRPSATLTIPKISEESLGALFMFFETATSYMGELLGVNAFDQPGVEAGKKEARRILETGKKSAKTKG
jgi:glucose-6-phosphate isomerase